jgi:hypothetical protein
MTRLSLLIACIAVSAAADTATLTIDVTKNRHRISPEIYGLAFATAAQLRELNVPLNRWGGNSTTRYNWQLNASNHANDYFFESIADDTTADTFIADTRSANAQVMMTIPTIGWVAKLGPNRGKLASFSTAKYGPQQATDPFMPDAGNGIRPNGQPVTGNDPNDANVSVDSDFQQAWVRRLAGRAKYYLLDNEPSLWFSTHRDVHPDGPTMEEVATRTIDYASKIRATDANALIVGPEEWGWFGYFYSGFDQQKSAQNGFTSFPDRQAHGGVEYIPFLLNRIRDLEQSRGTRLLDVVTVHFYPQGGEFSDDVSTDMQLRRNRSTRSLWDPNYVDESWIADRVNLIARLRGWAESLRAGTMTGITEYNWGAEGHINGATAQADILGIFGREGLDLAARWTTPNRGTPAYNAIRMYRNYDGNGSTFGDTSVRAIAPNPDVLSCFAAIRSSDQALTIMIIDKALSGKTTATITVNGFTGSPRAQRWQLTSNTIERLSDVPLTLDLPPQSITLLVVSSAASRRRAVHR